MRSTPLRGLGKSLPSWLHMTSVGVPSVASWGDNVGVLPPPSQSASQASSLNGGGSNASEGYYAAGNAYNNAAEDEGDSASETVPHRRRSSSSFPILMDSPTTSPTLLAAIARGVSPSQSHHAGPSAPSSWGHYGSGHSSGVHWDASSDDGLEGAAAEMGSASGRRCTGRSSTSLRRMSSVNGTTQLSLSASVLDMATQDCTDTSVDGSGKSGVWGALFGVASSSTLAGGPQHNGFGVDLFQY